MTIISLVVEVCMLGCRAKGEQKGEGNPRDNIDLPKAWTQAY
jgi:hypothetical protein